MLSSASLVSVLKKNRIPLNSCLLFGSVFLVYQAADYFAFSRFDAVLNDKAVFGFLLDNILAMVLSVLLFIVAWFMAGNLKWPKSLFAVFAAAVTSNILDRVLYGGVVDYLHLSVIPTFNLADLSIVLTMLAIFILQIRKDTKKPL